MAAVGAERRNGTGEVSLVSWRTNLAETSLRLGLSKLEEPSNRKRMGALVAEAGLVPELSGYAHTLAVNGTSYAKDSLRWGLADVKRNNLQVDPEVIKAAEARLERQRI